MIRIVRVLGAVAIFVLSAAVLPRWWCGLDADGWMDGDVETERALADVVAARALAGVRPADLHTGSEHFDGEWALVTNQMTVLGLGQLVLRHPELRETYVPAMRAAARAMITDEALAFGTHRWHERGLDPAVLAGDHGHVYLGYAALGLAMLRHVEGDAMEPELAAIHDRSISALARRLENAPHGMIETFPGVTFPADVSSAIGAIGLTGRPEHRALLARWAKLLRRKYVDAKTGLVVQTVDPVGRPRGSGTAIMVYFLSFADRALARDLYRGLSERTFLGFGGIRENSSGDIDSGPVVFGVSVAATGFGLAGPRMFGDRDVFRELFRTAYLFGAPTGGGYLLGSGLGDAILLAMMTAQ